jgi:hypothetical protein
MHLAGDCQSVAAARGNSPKSGRALYACRPLDDGFEITRFALFRLFDKQLGRHEAAEPAAFSPRLSDQRYAKRVHHDDRGSPDMYEN